ncbi:hypothetical protein, partial [Membranihabitans marinus]|uniref:hypothetical protein n=1 Tax=Membranihabitans marinus TaxID=1227546 RepID=UPI001F3613C1
SSFLFHNYKVNICSLTISVEFYTISKGSHAGALWFKTHRFTGQSRLGTEASVPSPNADLRHLVAF